ncbi:putative bifunctional diguanylate cyclase/phosphodiesterase [Spirochaeta thermophila]|uniref:Putative sensory box/GGDEF family protein n=1 Tax=Winmispira thermophila (strain ATCC 49972 / DSM 6192 / RI 19.B1) TaxID=665571 RepID=E0RP74_WINT6|nr:GGDEF domain-containing phosphodiesterase [Spirochaeta thermophila]ADN01268.1 putative sensory box/GGDEF family protein [Spirochaeta thermophila DSM 6192]
MTLSEVEQTLRDHGVPDAVVQHILKTLVAAKRTKDALEKLKEEYRQVRRLVDQSPDTGLPVRKGLEQDFSRLTEEASREGKKLALFLIRLDEKYERIENSRDRSRVLLFKTARRIRRVLPGLYQGDRPEEFLGARLVSGGEEAVSLGKEISDVVMVPQDPPAEDIQFGCYVGIVLFPDHGEEWPALFEMLHIAVAEAMREKERAVLYTGEIGRRHFEEELVLEHMRRVLRDGFEEFHLAYQPIVDRSLSIVGAEALIRWDNPALGSVSPARFIPLAESTGDIMAIGQWVLYRACKQLSLWHARGFRELFISVNLSPPQFKLHDLAFRVAGILKSLAFEGKFLKLEVTEGVLMDHPEEAVEKMNELRAMGVKLCIDDFGTGYSSLGYLRRFPFDTLKIDRSFVVGVEDDPSLQGIVRAIIGVARALGISTLAEGVENERQLDFLMAEGCEMFQGFYFARPVPPEDFERLLREGVRVARA